MSAERSYPVAESGAQIARLYRVAGAFLLLLVAGVIASTWQAIRATLAERTAESRKREADDARKQAEKGVTSWPALT